MLSKTYWLIISLITLAVILIIASFSLKGQVNNKLQVAFLDVGQGDAVLVRTPGGLNALIDGGPDQLVLSRLSKVLPWWERTIDLMILTHAHDDHFAGLEAVLKHYTVRELVVSSQAMALPKEFWDLAQERQIKIQLFQVGNTINLGGAKLDVLWPEAEPYRDINDTSLVIKLSYGNKKFWLTGDSGILVEETLLAKGLVESVDVLKVGHHGSDTANSEAYLQTLKPKYSVISVGEGNKLGLPNQRIIRRLERLETEILRTDELGTIVFSTDGQNLRQSLIK